MKKSLIALAAFVLLLVNACFSGTSAVEKATVKIYTVTNVADYTQPWQMLGQRRSYGSGCIIEGNLILTNAHVISDQTFIQVLKNGETEKYVAEVAAVDHDVDLAVLRVKDKAFFRGVSPIAVGGLPNLSDKVKVIGFPMGGDKLSITEGVVSRIEVTSYSHSYESFLTVQIDAAINPGNSGGPVISDGKIVGVAFQSYNSSQSIGYAIPADIIKSFLKDIKNKKYRGFPNLGINIQNLENESFRKKLGMASGQTGVVVNTVSYNASGWGILKQGDVIMAVDGVKIANDGTVPFKGSSRIDMSYIVKSKRAGDKALLYVLREGKALKIPIVLKKEIPVIPGQLYDVKPTYYIFGGVVFIPLTGNYLEQMWGDWSEKKQPANLMTHILGDYATKERQEIVLVRQVLADESNIGYEYFRDLVVTKISGISVAGIKDLIDKIENTKDKYLEIELENESRIVLDVEKSKKASEGILIRYQVQYDRSADLRVLQSGGV